MTYEKLRWGTVIGVIDSYGSVNSVFVPFKSNIPRHHEYHFPCHNQNRWGWTFSEGLGGSILGEILSEEGVDKISRHLWKKYKIKTWENGMTDFDYFANLKLDKN